MAMVALIVSLAAEADSAYQQKEGADFNAQVDAMNAQIAREKGQLDATQIARQGRYQEGETKAAYAGSGVSVATGSPLDELASQHINNSFKSQVAEFNALSEAAGYDSQAKINQFMGQQAITQGVASMFGTVASFYGAGYGGKNPDSLEPTTFEEATPQNTETPGTVAPITVPISPPIAPITGNPGGG